MTDRARTDKEKSCVVVSVYVQTRNKQKMKFLVPNSWTQFPTIPISQLCGWAGISNLPQYEVQFGLYSLPSLSLTKASPQNQKAYCQVFDWSGFHAITCAVMGKEYECGSGSTMGP